ncbi:MAG: tRNA lysidine(34) synthetase TilS [Gammaproteobacteria bacterium]|nr:tRNA lysidine(34) synthetase TilS [Gammaproteobacteria bacterium]
MDWFQSALTKLSDIFESHSQTNQWWLGLSGGADSMVLLELLYEFKRTRPDLKLGAIHVNHSISPNAHNWAEFCKKCCQDYNIEYYERTIQIGNQTRQGLEKPLREARWQAFSDVIQDSFLSNEEGSIKPVLFVAHHQDDQVETLLLNLLRGTGVAGASGMSEWEERSDFFLARPLIDIPKQSIITFAEENNLDWVDDESNQEVQYRRNFLRHNVLPVIAEQWPNYSQTLSRFTRNMQMTGQLVSELAKIDVRATQLGDGLDLNKFRVLSFERQLNLLRHWILQKQRYSPSEVQLTEMLKQLKNLDSDSNFQFKLNDDVLTVHENELLLISEKLFNAESYEYIWRDLSKPIDIQEINGTLLVEKGGELRLPNSSETVRVCSRKGGENCWPILRDKRTSLKKVFQELGIARWKRASVPLVFYNDILVCVVGVFVCKEGLVEKEQQGINIIVK